MGPPQATFPSYLFSRCPLRVGERSSRGSEGPGWTRLPVPAFPSPLRKSSTQTGLEKRSLSVFCHRRDTRRDRKQSPSDLGSRVRKDLVGRNLTRSRQPLGHTMVDSKTQCPGFGGRRGRKSSTRELRTSDSFGVSGTERMDSAFYKCGKTSETPGDLSVSRLLDGPRRAVTVVEHPQTRLQSRSQ